MILADRVHPTGQKRRTRESIRAAPCWNTALIAPAMGSEFDGGLASTAATCRELTDNGRAVPITHVGGRGKLSLTLVAVGRRPGARSVGWRRMAGRLDRFAAPRLKNPPAVDHGWQEAMCA